MEKTIKKFAEAIKRHEGWILPGQNPNYPNGSISYRNNNPGNLRYSRFQAGTRGGFSFFNTYQKGFEALCFDINLKFTGQTKTGLGPNSTIYEFFRVYAPSADRNNPKAYAEFVASTFGVPASYTLQQLVNHYEPKEKIRFQTKNDNAFVCLFLKDDTIDGSQFLSFLEEAKKGVYRVSEENLVLDGLAHALPLKQWDNEYVKQYVRANFELSDFQAVVCVYAPGKFRQDFAQMNPLDKEFGIFINQSFEKDIPNEANEDTILLHELFQHAFPYYVGLPNSVWGSEETPRDFSDDWQDIKPYVQKLYYKRPSQPEPSQPPVEPIPVEPSHTMPEPVKPGVKTSELWLSVLAALGGLAVSSGYLSASQVSDLVQGIEKVVGGIIAIAPVVAYIWSRVRVKTR